MLNRLPKKYSERINVTEAGCWIWTGVRDYNGYGRYSKRLATRLIWELTGRELDPKKGLCHKCPNTSCVNPDHLYLGTQKENMADAIAAGKTFGFRKVTDQDVEAIKEMLAQGHRKSYIARRFNISPQWFTKFQNGELKHAKPTTPSK